MTTFVPLKATNAGAVAAFAATSPAGDAIKAPGGAVMIEFRNGYSSAITVTIAPTRTAGKVAGAGRVTIPSRTLSIPAGADAAFKFASDEIGAYINSSGLIPIAYTGGNVLLLMRAFQLSGS